MAPLVRGQLASERLDAGVRREGYTVCHWYDLVSLDEAGIATAALADRSITEAIDSHKSQFFIEKDRNGETVDYQAVVSGKISLVPEGNALSELKTDYSRMIGAQMLFHEPEPFDALMQRCSDLERHANA